MAEFQYMADMKPGDRAVVVEIGVECGMRRRLQDLGLIQGTRVECLGRSSLGDPSAYLIRRTVIALRRNDTSKIRVRGCRRDG